MANIKSQIKRNIQNNKRRLRNRMYRGYARTATKAAQLAIESGVPESKEALMAAISQLDRAAERGVIHKNNAARRKGRLMKAFNKMEPVQATAAPAVAEPAAEPEVKAAPRRGRAKAAPAAEAEVPAEEAPKAEKKTTRRSTAKKAAE